MISPVSNTAEHLSQRAKANASCAAYAAGIIKYSRDGEHSRDAATEEIQEQKLRNISAPFLREQTADRIDEVRSGLVVPFGTTFYEEANVLCRKCTILMCIRCRCGDEVRYL